MERLSNKREAMARTLILIGSGMFSAIAMSSLSSVLPVIQRHFGGGSDSLMAKTVVMIVGISMIVTSPMTGWLVRRFGFKPVLIPAYATFLVFGCAGAFLPSLEAIIATRFVTGAAAAVIVATALSLIGIYYEGTPRDRRLGATHAISGVMIAGLIPLAAWLGAFNWRYAFAIHLIALPHLIVGALWLRPPPQPVKQAGANAAGIDFLRMLPLMLLAVAAGALAFSEPVLMPFHLVEIGNYGPSWAGLMFAIVIGCSVLSNMMFGELRRWLPGNGIYLLAFGLWTLGFMVIGLELSLIGAAAGSAIIGLGGGLVSPSLFSTVATISAPQNRPGNTGLIKAAFYSGPFLGPTVLHFVATGHPQAISFILLGAAAGVLAIGALVLLLLGHRGQSRSRPAGGGDADHADSVA